jgi:phage terminase large subunit-like protein
MAGIALILLVADDEEGAEVYSAARDTEQAGRVFNVAKRMVELSPMLSKRLRIYSAYKTIVDPERDSVYKVLPSDALGNLGENPHGILFDEIIAQPNRALWDALKTGFGTRPQPLMVAATTAGNDPASFAKAEHDYCVRIREKPELDPVRFVYIRGTPADADPFDEANWKNANPAMSGPAEQRFLSVRTLRDEAKEARENPMAENAFRQFRLNQWVQQSTRYMPPHVWNAAAGASVDLRSLAGRRAWAGLDLSTSVDITALALDMPAPIEGEQRGRLDPENHDVAWRFWLPEEGLSDLAKRTGGRAEQWVKEGWLELTEGDVIDYAAIRETIKRIAAPPPHGFGIQIEELAYDRWGATQLAIELQEDGLTVFPFGQTYKDLSPPLKLWDKLVRSGGYHHGANPVMDWMVDNLLVRRDVAGNIRPDKERSAEKIDGVVGAIMALDRAALGARKKKKRRTTMTAV